MSLFLKVFCRPGFENPNQVGDGNLSGKPAENVDMIFCAIDEDRLATGALQNASEVSVKT
jgi:hypothetical protein